jgi:hypothetical protein
MARRRETSAAKIIRNAGQIWKNYPQYLSLNEKSHFLRETGGSGFSVSSQHYPWNCTVRQQTAQAAWRLFASVMVQ